MKEAQIVFVEVGRLCRLRVYDDIPSILLPNRVQLRKIALSVVCLGTIVLQDDTFALQLRGLRLQLLNQTARTGNSIEILCFKVNAGAR